MTVVLNCAVLILMLKYAFAFAGVATGQPLDELEVGIILGVFSYIKISVVMIIVTLL